MRSIALIQLGALGISNLALRTRHVHKASTDSLFDFSVMKSAAFIFYFASAVFTFMGSTTLMAYLDVSAMARGVDTRVVPYLLSILNASSALGRISSGLLADRLGAQVNFDLPILNSYRD
jgi:MCP family monocarboxylic acid transporter-like MFS transporter 10